LAWLQPPRVHASCPYTRVALTTKRL